ncbi:Spp2/MOS2 G-patch domain [Trinorchestia longiramus]|nr:Spp2/MOS2 G-patch domain [Trinorchestia longiramus]
MEGAKFSLCFSKVIEKKQLQPSALKSIQDKQAGSKQEIIESIEGNVIKSNAPPEQELVIPLLQQDQDPPVHARAKQRKTQPQQGVQAPSLHAVPHGELTLEQQAEQALLSEAADLDSRAQHASSDASIPSQTELKTSTTLGSVPTLDDFEEVGVDNFGAALLRGMGWKKGEGVGSARNRKVVSIIEASNKTLGSAALRSKAGLLKQQGTHEQEEQLSLNKGSYALINAGRHKGTYGIVESVEEDHVLLRKAVGGAVVREVEANLTLVTKEHYSDSSRVINKEMFDKFKEAALNKNKSSKSSKKKYRSEDDSDENSRERKDKRSSKLDNENEKEVERKNSAARRHDETSSCLENSSHVSNARTSDSLPAKDHTEVNHTKKVVVKMEEIKEDKESVVRKESSNIYGINPLDSKSNTKTSEVKDRYKKLQEAVESHKAKQDRDCSYSDSRTLCQKEKSGRPEYFSNSGSKRRYSRSSSPERDTQPNKNAFLENESNRNKSKHRSHTRDGSKSARKEVQSKEEYLLSRYGDQSMNKHKDMTSGAGRTAPWVREGLTVRITSEKFKGGKYFKEKVVIENVVTAVQCVCRTSEGKVLSHVPPDILETVIPKLSPRIVMVVKGRHAGMVGRVLEQHKREQEASVQLQDDSSRILRLHYEQICQYNS